MDQRLKNSIPESVIKAWDINFKDSDFQLDLCLGTWVPFVRWYDVYSNIKFLRGDYTGLNEVYAFLEDSTSEEDIINSLKEAVLIEIDNEKKRR